MNAHLHPRIGELLQRCPALISSQHVTCAVSGGPDSMALLVLATSAGCKVTVVHVDHGLRPDSHLDAAIVRVAAERFGAMFQSVRVDVDGSANVEARARRARWNALGPDALTGHTADDQAETMLINLLRGAATDGLGGMGPANHPLLGLRRQETHELCRDLQITTIHDPSNDLAIYQRNRIRAELMPLMSEIAQRDIVPMLVRQSELLRDEAALLNELSLAFDPTDAKALAAAPVSLARRAIRRWLATEHPPDSATVNRVLAVARGEAQACETNDGRRVSRHQQRLSLEAQVPR